MNYKVLMFTFALFAPLVMADSPDSPDSPDAQVSGFYIRDVGVDVAACRRVPHEEIAFACHRLRKGKGFAILIRAYVPSMEVDTDAYYKTTFFFRKKPPLGEKLKLPNKEIFTFASAGSSSFPERTGCYGEAVDGEIEVVEKPNGILEVIYDAKFRMKSVDGRSSQCAMDDLVSRSFDTRSIDFKSLTPWLGLEENVSDAWNESHP